MTFLLDTHTLLWWLREPEALSLRVRGILGDPSSEMLLSAATPWEMAIKTGSGKLDAVDLLDDFESWMTNHGYVILQTTISQLIRSGLLPLHHHDPFDRLLAIQALDLGVPILSRDQVFDLYGVRRIWA